MRTLDTPIKWTPFMMPLDCLDLGVALTCLMARRGRPMDQRFWIGLKTLIRNQMIVNRCYRRRAYIAVLLRLCLRWNSPIDEGATCWSAAICVCLLTPNHMAEYAMPSRRLNLQKVAPRIRGESDRILVQIRIQRLLEPPHAKSRSFTAQNHRFWYS